MRYHAILAAMAMMATVPASAEGCEPTTSEPDVDALGMYYYVNDHELCLVSGLCSIWLYEESNGLAGLQRADDVVDDTCGGAIRGDTIVF